MDARSRQARCILDEVLLEVTHQEEDPRCERDTAEDTRQRLVGGQGRAAGDGGHVHDCFALQTVSGEGGDWCCARQTAKAAQDCSRA